MQYKDDSYYIDQILAGEMNAFVFLVDKHKSKAFNVAFRILKSRENAEEVTQDSFLKAYQSLKDFRRESKFSSWLYKIIFNNAMSLLRKKKLKIDSYDDENFTWMEPADTLKELEKFHGQEQKKYINEAIHKLSGEDASIVTLFYLDDYSIEEICEITGLGISNVKVKLFRSRKTLHNELNKILQSEVKEIF